MNGKKRSLILLVCAVLALVFLPAPYIARGENAEDDLSKEELMEILKEAIPASQEAQLDDYLVMPDDYVAPKTDAFQILLVGIDTYKLSSRGRSDTMILVQLDPKNSSIKLVSLMRDMYVKIPGRNSNRLNAAYAFGGINLLLQTLKANFGIEPDAYVIVNFSRMAKLIDAIGGVKVKVSSRELSALNSILKIYNVKMGRSETRGLLKRSGTQNLTGDQAMAFSRIRKIDSDFQRTSRQRVVVEAAFHKIMDMSWDKIGELVIDNLDNVLTNLTGADAIRLVPMAMAAKEATFDTLQIPVKGGYASKTISGMAVLVPNLKTCVAEINKFLYGEDGQ